MLLKKSGNATIFISKDEDDSQYGKVVNNKIVGDSDDSYYHSITGVYVFPQNSINKIKQLELSERGLLEIISLSKIFQSEEKLQIQQLGSDCMWLDTNTFDNLLMCGNTLKCFNLKK